LELLESGWYLIGDNDACLLFVCLSGFRLKTVHPLINLSVAQIKYKCGVRSIFSKIQRKKKEMQKKLQNAKNQSMKSFSKKEPKYKTNYEKRF